MRQTKAFELSCGSARWREAWPHELDHSISKSTCCTSCLCECLLKLLMMLTDVTAGSRAGMRLGQVQRSRASVCFSVRHFVQLQGRSPSLVAVRSCPANRSDPLHQIARACRLQSCCGLGLWIQSLCRRLRSTNVLLFRLTWTCLDLASRLTQGRSNIGRMTFFIMLPSLPLMTGST